MDKQELRKIMLDKRKRINNKEELSNIIINKIISLDIYKEANVIAIYNSLDNEVNTKDLINKSIINKKVLLPKIVNNKIVFIKINKDTNYTKSKIGVIEPIGNVYSDKIDLIIVPGVSFDRKLNRLGFGKGYYDKFLSNNNNIFKIGVCFDEQIINKLPTESHDIKMNLVITDKRVLKKI